MAHSTPLGDKTVPMDEFWRSDGSSDNSTIDCSKLVSYSTAMKIAEKENGVIKIQSEVNEGTPVMKDLEFPTGSASKDPNREPLGSIMNRMWKRRRTNSKGPASQNQEKVSEGNVYDFHEEHSEGDQIDNNVPASNTPPEIFKRKRDPNDEEEETARDQFKQFNFSNLNKNSFYRSNLIFTDKNINSKHLFFPLKFFIFKKDKILSKQHTLLRTSVES